MALQRLANCAISTVTLNQGTVGAGRVGTFAYAGQPSTSSVSAFPMRSDLRIHSPHKAKEPKDPTSRLWFGMNSSRLRAGRSAA